MTNDEFITNLILLSFFDRGLPGYKNNKFFRSTVHGLNVELVDEWDDDYRVVRVYIQNPLDLRTSTLHVSAIGLETGLEEIIKYIASLREVTSP